MILTWYERYKEEIESYPQQEVSFINDLTTHFKIKKAKIFHLTMQMKNNSDTRVIGWS